MKEMIGHITGKVLETHGGYTLIEAGNIGYVVFITPDTLKTCRVGENVRLWTHLAVRENALDLYGFADREELRFFEMLLSVPSIGPKSALGILSIATVETLKMAISEENSSYLTKVSGIGRKTAEKIVIELKDKVGFHAEESSLKGEEDALEALVAMGYSISEARGALKEVPRDITDSGERLRAALKALSGTNNL